MRSLATSYGGPIAERLRQLREGQILIQPWNGKGDQAVPAPHPRLDGRRVRTGRNARAHTRLGSGLRSAQRVVRPEVVDSRVLSHTERLQDLHAPSQKEGDYRGPGHEHEVTISRGLEALVQRSYSTRIQEVDDPGTPEERLLPAGDDHGFLWRLYSYWRFEERDGGVYLECQALS